MECEQFRERIAADPARADEQMRSHAESCKACAAFAARLTAGEQLLQEALRFDVNALKRAAAAGHGAAFSPAAKRLAFGGLAAGIVAAVALWLALGRGPGLSDEELVAAVVEHWYLEPESWIQTSATVSNAELLSVLDDDLTLDVTKIGPISYVKSCFVAGRWIPHLVVQGREGPVMVLFLPNRSLAAPLPLSLPAEGLDGSLMPLDSGSIAVLGEEAEPTEVIKQQLAAAVEWSI